MTTQEKSGLGILLKGERQKRGFTLDQLAHITRLRRQFLEALEDENWDNLPSPVYVRGFIRAYAQSVGFDVKDALSLFESIAPVTQEIPMPLVVLKEPNRKRLYLILALIAALAAGIYLWADSGGVLFFQKMEAELPGEQISSSVDEPQLDEPTAESEPQPLCQDTDAPILEEATSEHATESLESRLDHIAEAVALVPDYSLAPLAPASGGLVLTGIVNLRTYIKIYVDDSPPKEYIFQPGSRPQWVAEKGFDILVGNAGGIEFDFNGERITDLGEIGKVIRISFPEGFKSGIYGTEDG
jgi:cytoskeleton protein RodZ